MILIPTLLTSPLTVNLPISKSQPSNPFEVSAVGLPILVKIPPSADFEREILAPLRAKQEQERVAALEAAQKAEAQAQAELAIPQAQAPQAPPRAPTTGNCGAWIAAAGIADVGSALILIGRESGCNPNAVNPSSGACGVAQELPCGKSGCAIGDGACQVRWMNTYVLERYGSWAGAVAWHNGHNWY